MSDSPKHISLTDVDYINVNRIGEGAAQGVGGHHSDVVIDPNGCIILIEEAGVLSGREVVRTLVHCVRAVREAEEQHVIERVCILLCYIGRTVCIIYATISETV